MALLFMDGFDIYATSGNVAGRMAGHWNNVANFGSGFTVGAGRFNGYAIGFGATKNNQSKCEVPFSGFGTANKLIIGFHMQVPAGASGQLGLGLMKGHYGNPSLTSYCGLLFRNNDAQLFGGTATFNPVATCGIPSGWHHYELILTKISATQMSLQLYIDEGLALTFSPLNYGAEPMRWETWNDGVTGKFVDHFYVLNDAVAGNQPIDKLGMDARIETLWPTAPKNNVDVWVATGATNTADAVNDPLYTTTKYAATPNANTIQEFNFGQLQQIVSTKVSQIRTVAKGVSGAQLKHIVNGSVVGTKALTAAYANYSTIVELSASEVNAMTAGVSS